MKKIAILLTALLILPGCGYFMAKAMMEEMTKFTKEMKELELKAERERRSQLYTVEGTIKGIETIKVERPSPAANDKRFQEIQQEIKSLNKNSLPNAKVDIKIKTTRSLKIYNVIFKDGREVEFTKLPSKPLEKGVYYKITYNGMDEIIKIQRVNP